ncbi:TPA: hypothetical protein ENX78_10720 [Candidatus Poribacteria bacterium]|nr:hypothetical protein [Candidatus Poribacteria bacterium]
MGYSTKIEKDIRDHLDMKWSDFQDRYRRIASKLESGMRLHEKDVETIFQALAEGPLGYEIEQLNTQQNYADYALIDRGLKLAIIEIKSFRLFANDIECPHLQSALVQAARYANRHRTPYIMAFDGETIVLARVDPSNIINVHLAVNIKCDQAPPDLFFFTHYGLFRHPTNVLCAIPYDASEDEGLYKNHHGVKLHYSCFAYVGDIRDKSTWIAPYRNEDGSVDTNRIGHAVNYLLSPGGYRGQKATSQRIPNAATPFVALKLAKAYKEIGKWNKPESLFGFGGKPDPQCLLWTYLYQHGLDDAV